MLKGKTIDVTPEVFPLPLREIALKAFEKLPTCLPNKEMTVFTIRVLYLMVHSRAWSKNKLNNQANRKTDKKKTKTKSKQNKRMHIFL